MNLVLLSEADFSDSKKHVSLTGRRHQHIREILKSSVGDTLCVGLLGGKIGKGRIADIDDKSVKMAVTLQKNPPAPLPVTLVLALPRPIVLNRILGHVTALGVKKIFLIHSKRVEKSYWKSPVLEKASIQEQLILGLEQAKDTVLPEVFLRTKFKPFVEDELPRLAKGRHAFVADPQAQNPAPRGQKGRALLALGPEGGFIPYEVELLKKAGCQPVHFGRRILRVETAVIAALSRSF